jgi:hypothetical protein
MPPPWARFSELLVRRCANRHAANFTMSLTVVSGATLKSLNYTFTWSNPDTDAGSPSFDTGPQSVPAPPSPTVGLSYPNQPTKGGLQVSATFGGTAEVETNNGFFNCPFSTASVGMVVVSSYIDNHDDDTVWGLLHAYNDHVRAPGNPNTTWSAGNSYFTDGTTEDQIGSLV